MSNMDISITVKVPDDIEIAEVVSDVWKRFRSFEGEQDLKLLNWEPIQMELLRLDVKDGQEDSVEQLKDLGPRPSQDSGSFDIPEGVCEETQQKLVEKVRKNALDEMGIIREYANPEDIGPHVAAVVSSRYEKIFARKIKDGETPEQAMEALVARINDLAHHNLLRDWCEDELFMDAELTGMRYDNEHHVYFDITNPTQLTEPSDEDDSGKIELLD